MEKEKSISILRTGHSQFPHLLPWPGLNRAACAGERSCLLTWQCCGPGSLAVGWLGSQGVGRVGSLGGEWAQGGAGWCGAPHPLPGLGKGGGSTAHKQARAWSLPHHTRGSRPGPEAPAEAVKGAELPALHLGLLGALRGNGKLGCPAGAGSWEISAHPLRCPVAAPLRENSIRGSRCPPPPPCTPQGS